MSADIRCGSVVLALLCLSAAFADGSQTYTFGRRDSFELRLQALAILQTLNAELLSHDSATATLESWCGEHHLAPTARIVAVRVADVERDASQEQRALLQAQPGEPVRYRRVELRCGEVTLSEADNWYLPSRLSADMNAALDSSGTPFGKVVQPLHFQRHVLSAELLWHPLPSGWEMGARPQRLSAAPLAVPHSVLQHRAVLSLPDGTPFSEVVETYTGAVLVFPGDGR